MFQGRCLKFSLRFPFPPNPLQLSRTKNTVIKIAPNTFHKNLPKYFLRNPFNTTQIQIDLLLKSSATGFGTSPYEAFLGRKNIGLERPL